MMPSQEAMELATKISSLVVGKDMDTIYGALAFSLAGFVLLSNPDDEPGADNDTDMFLHYLAGSVEALNGRKPA